MTINDLLNNEYVLMFILAVLIVTPIIAIPKWLLMKENENNNIYGNDNDDNATENKSAKVIDKRTSPHPLDRTITINFVVFEFENRERVELAIKNNDIYNTIIKGDEGILTYKGKKFLRFERVRTK